MSDPASLARIDPSSVPMKDPAATLEEVGPAPQLMWLPISDLVVDPAYQRPITGHGRLNVGRIAARFWWTRFSPVIVALIAGGRYAIVDGQHRATAAAIVGFTAVPCQIILAAPGEQAAAFTAINGAVTKVNAMSLHKAAFAAGDPGAIATEACARAARFKILHYPKSQLNQEPGETMAIGSIREAMGRYGDEIVTLALRCIRETWRNNVKGGAPGPVIMGLAHTLWLQRESAGAWNPEAIIRQFEGIIILREHDKAVLTERPKGVATWFVLAERLKKRIAELVPGKAAA